MEVNGTDAKAELAHHLRKVNDEARDGVKDFLGGRYCPATVHDAEIWLTTAEITRRLQQHFPWAIAEWDGYDGLLELNFLFTDLGKLEIVWLLRHRANEVVTDSL